MIKGNYYTYCSELFSYKACNVGRFLNIEPKFAFFILKFFWKKQIL